MPQEMQNLFEQAFNPPPSKKKGKRKRAASWFDENPLEDGDLTMGEIVDEGIGLAINLFTGEGAERAEASAENEDIEEKLFDKEAGELSAAEMLTELSDIENDPDSPFTKFAKKLKDGSQEITEKALDDFIEDARREILREVRKEMERRKEQLSKGKDPNDPAARRFENKLAMKMGIMKKVMGEGDFNDLCDDIEGLGMYIDPSSFAGMSLWDIAKKNLTAVLEEMGANKSGQSKGFFQVMNGIGMLLGKQDKAAEEAANEKEEEPSPQEKADLAQTIKDFVLKEANPANRNQDPMAVKIAMFGLKQIVMPEEFELFIDTLNAMPGRYRKFTKEDFATLPETKDPEREMQNGIENPVLTAPNPWEN